MARVWALWLASQLVLVHVAAPRVSPQSRPVSARSIGISAAIDASALSIRGAVTATVRTPIGSIPVTGHLQATYSCDARILGALSYHPLVRLFARIKGVGLVRSVEASVSPVAGSSCASFPDSLTGHVTISDPLVTGSITVGSETVLLRGPTWAVGDSVFAANLLASRPGHSYMVQIEMFFKDRSGSADRRPSLRAPLR